MENLKKGDIVSLVNDKIIRISSEHKFRVASVRGKYISINSYIDINKNEVFKIGESKMQYEESNRYKLAQEIKKTGFSAKALSRIVAGNESYFYNKTGVARFNKKGDISNEALNLALTNLAFAERELLGVGAETVGVAEEGCCDEVVEYTGTPYDEGKSKSNKPLFIGAAVVIFIVLIIFILNNSQVF